MFLLNYSVLLHLHSGILYDYYNFSFVLFHYPLAHFQGRQFGGDCGRNLKENNRDYFTQMKLSFSGSVLALPTKA